MPNAPATYLGLACAAALLAAIVPGVSDAASSPGLPDAPVIAHKGDRLASTQAAARRDVTSTRIDGAPGQASILMLTRDGAIAYHAQDKAGVTLAAKNVALPPLPDRMAAKQAPSGTAASAAPVAPAPRLRLPVGCERLVSVLVTSGERDRIGRCIS
jgi:hypothetical protein